MQPTYTISIHEQHRLTVNRVKCYTARTQIWGQYIQKQLSPIHCTYTWSRPRHR